MLYCLSPVRCVCSSSQWCVMWLTKNKYHKYNRGWQGQSLWLPSPLTLPHLFPTNSRKNETSQTHIQLLQLFIALFSPAFASSANATPEFEGRGGEELGTELSNTLYKVFNNKRSVDLKSLCISEGEHCWVLYVDVLVSGRTVWLSIHIIRLPCF